MLIFAILTGKSRKLNDPQNKEETKKSGGQQKKYNNRRKTNDRLRKKMRETET